MSLARFYPIILSVFFTGLAFGDMGQEEAAILYGNANREFFYVEQPGFSLKVHRNGSVSDVRVGGLRVIDLIEFDVRGAEWHPPLQAYFSDPARVSTFEKEETDAGVQVLVEGEFSLGTGRYEISKVNFSFKTQIEASPEGKVRITSKFKPLRDFKSKALSLSISLPADIYAGKDFKVRLRDGSVATHIFPKTLKEKGLATALGRIKLFPRADIPVEIASSRGKKIYVTDARSWSPDIFVLNMYAPYSYPDLKKGQEGTVEVFLKLPTEKVDTSIKEKTCKVEVDFSKVVKKICTEASLVHFDAGLMGSPIKQELIKRVKPRLIRCQITRYNPWPSPEKWDFSEADRVVKTILNMGAEPMICIGPGAPPWMSVNPPKYDWASWGDRPADNKKFAEFCAVLVKHYNLEKKLAIKYWEIGNEPDGVTELTPEDWGKTTILAGQAMRKVDPSIKIGGPSLMAPNMEWMERFLKVAGKMLDFVSWHRYGGCSYNSERTLMERTSSYGMDVRSIRGLVKRIVGKNLELSLNEINLSAEWEIDVDNRIHALFNAAWYASVLKHLIEVGCELPMYYCASGGLGVIYGGSPNRWGKGPYLPYDAEPGEQTYPVYHAIWMYASLLKDKLVYSNSDSKHVESIATKADSYYTLTLINKEAHPYRAQLEILGLPAGKLRVREYVLDKTTFPAVRKAKDTLTKGLPYIQKDLNSPGKQCKLELLLKEYCVYTAVIEKGGKD